MASAGSDGHTGNGHAAWLEYPRLPDTPQTTAARGVCSSVQVRGDSPLLRQAGEELTKGLDALLGTPVSLELDGPAAETGIVIETDGATGPGGYALLPRNGASPPQIAIVGGDDAGCLYGAFALLRLLGTGAPLPQEPVTESPAAPLRMLDHWDGLTGEIERGYAGRSIFFADGEVTRDLDRIRRYGRLLASIGVNAIAINNVNVDLQATELLTTRHLPNVAELAETLRPFGVRLALAVNFASPARLGGLGTADPEDPDVARWWHTTASTVYEHIPDLLGFVVKASSEGQPGPHSYGRTQAQGANVIAAALAPHHGVVLWRAFVYNSQQDWRDTTTDRPKAAYEEFVPLDGSFAANVALQIKNGPVDYQVREPPSPLFGAAPDTSKLLEVQLTQEYTGQQVHVFYLAPMWREVLDFDTHADGEGSTISERVVHNPDGRPIAGMVGVANVGDDPNWTGHLLAQANLYAFGRLAWQPSLHPEAIATEWSRLTFGLDDHVTQVVTSILMRSPEAYESYTSPLGLGWMVTPGVHYGPDPEGYEYDRWGTYLRADRDAIGVDRGVAHGTGFTAQYHEPWRSIFEDPRRCPQELLLFFHRVRYDHVLPSGKTLAQHVYDTHFAGVEAVEDFIEAWRSIEGRLDETRYESVLARLQRQLDSAIQWRDVVNAYFHRYSGITDDQGRRLY